MKTAEETLMDALLKIAEGMGGLSPPVAIGLMSELLALVVVHNKQLAKDHRDLFLEDIITEAEAKIKQRSAMH